MASGMRSVRTKKLKLKFVKNLLVFWKVIVNNTMLRRRLDYTFVYHILLRLPHNFDPCHVFCCPGLDQSTQRDRSQTVEDHFKVKHRLKHNCEDNGSFFPEPAGSHDQGGERAEEEAGGESRAQHQAVCQAQQGLF